MKATSTVLASLVVGCVLVTRGSAPLAAPEQSQPGQMTQAKVWIQNTLKSEAVPVSLADVTVDTPLRVQVTGTPTVTISPGAVVEARRARQSWQYQTVTILSGQDPAGALAGAGQDGWEATGLEVPGPGGAVLILLKRPR